MNAETYSIKIILEKDCFEDLSAEIERLEKILADDTRCKSYLVDYIDGGANNSEGIYDFSLDCADDVEEELEAELREMLFCQ